MDGTKFDEFSRLLAGGHSRRKVLKGLFAGGTLAAVGMVKTFDYAAAQCLDDGIACSSGTDCCSGNCDASTGYCFTPGPGECIEDGQACAANGDCCSGACDTGATNVCFTPDEGSTCLDDGEACSAGRDCCSGTCDATTGYCAATVEDSSVCIADGGACAAGRDCCSGNCDATTGYCFTPATTVMPATGSGMSQSSDASKLLPVATLGAAAVIGAHRMRAAQKDVEA